MKDSNFVLSPERLRALIAQADGAGIIEGRWAGVAT
jgi:hypothetical protein